MRVPVRGSELMAFPLAASRPGRPLADRARNRHDYLAGMFGRIGARLDKLPNEKNSPGVSDLIREELSKFFASAAKSP
jgi:hypothetical protein